MAGQYYYTSEVHIITIVITTIVLWKMITGNVKGAEISAVTHNDNIIHIYYSSIMACNINNQILLGLQVSWSC